MKIKYLIILFFLSLLFIGCVNKKAEITENLKDEKQIVSIGDKVRAEYVGTLDDGIVFDSSEKQGKLLEFTAGVGEMIKGFDNAVVGMKLGEEKQIRLEPKEAYGKYDPSLSTIMRRKDFPENIILKEGTILYLQDDKGMKIPVRVTKINGDNVTIDANHPLAGKALNFKIKIVEIL